MHLRSRRASRRPTLGPLSLSLLAAALVAAPVAAQTPAPMPTSALSGEAFDALRYRHVGPVGNRVSAVTGVPGDPNVYWIGAASGGIWKTTDGGHSWRPVFDDHGVQSIGALAVAPSDPDVVWAGTGEPFIRSNVSHGAGVFRSDDGGESWVSTGLEATGRVARIVVHPDDPGTVWVAALGHLYGDQEERGVFRTRDGGARWERVLFTDAGTGASDLWLDPDDPDHLIAGMWTMHIRTWGRWSGGPGGGLFESTDGGTTWSRMEGRGLPTGTIGKVGLAGTPADPDRIYALIETNANAEIDDLDYEHEGVVWRSDDGGASWRMINADHALVQRPHYYTRATVSTGDPDEVHFLATRHSVSTDGGLSTRGGGAGGDNHDMWIDPLLPDRMIVGHDGGVSISTTRGTDWYRPQLPIAQMYHVNVDTRVPYYLYGNRQDGPSTHGPSNTLAGGGIGIGEWRSVGGCETGWAVPDTVSNDVVWSGCYEGMLDRHVLSTGHSRTVTVWPDNPEGWPAADLRYRFQWTFPIAISPHDPETVYVGSQHLHRTRDGGQSWQVMSPDLSSGTDSLLLKTGGLTPDDASPTYAAVAFAIAESPLTPGEIWVGTNDGRLQLTRDDGATWTDVSDAVPGLPVFSTISSIEPSRHTPGTAYLAVDAHQIGDFRPLLWKTTDYGASWASISTGIREGPLSFTHVLREDPQRPGLLYAGTENGLHVSLDDGATWAPLQSNLPPAPVHWLTIQTHFNDLVVSTYGRGFWIADDVTPLQQITPEIASGSSALFRPRDAYRFLRRESAFSQPGDPAAGDNPPSGASINWWLGEGARDVKLEVLDAAGEIVAEVGTPAPRPGLNRAWWGLSLTGSARPTIRTRPIGHSHLELSPAGTRGVPDGGRVTPQAVPGRYTVRLTVDGTVHEQPLTVLMDPASEGSMEGIRAQNAMQLELRAEANRVVAAIDSLEVWRAELHARRDGGGLTAEQADLLADLDALTHTLYDLRLTGGQDSLRWPRQLWAKITSLAGYISGSDHPPTDQAREVHELYRGRLTEVEAEVRALRARVRGVADLDPTTDFETGGMR
ncbi:hypothetical protein WI460_02240 [Gemmatimonadota bacterium Y43]|uniref:WD40/YVTN/BNR-like repeat-containing protein n=1 Tax=Gaopeijia maritima TaxID=3119007 RepID=UPI00328D47BE